MMKLLSVSMKLQWTTGFTLLFDVEIRKQEIKFVKIMCWDKMKKSNYAHMAMHLSP